MFSPTSTKYEDMNHIGEIASVISALALKCNGEPQLVAICGAADLGKTYLSTQLVSALAKIGTSAGHLTLDSYLMERSKREAIGISGYQPEAYDILKIESDSVAFLNGGPIEYHPYDHAAGKSLSTKIIINPCQVLLLDGLHSMHQNLRSYLNYSIFICAPDDLLLTMRHQADIKKRKQSAEYSKINLKNELTAYKWYVESYRYSANVVYELKEQWQYERTT